jgi:hypothetical protein
MNYDNEKEFLELAKDLRSKHPKGEDEFVDEVVFRLLNNDYHDFYNERFAAPKMQMISDFTKLGRQDIVDRIKNGDFDQ